MSKSKADEILLDELDIEEGFDIFDEDFSHEAASEREKSRGVTRRNVLMGFGGCAVLLALGGTKYLENTPLIRPPGGQDEERLIGSCIRCERCYEVCPRKVIAPAHIEDGLVGMHTPTLDFSNDYCDFCEQEREGTPRCVQVCPTNALSLSAGAQAPNVIIGKAVIDTFSCLAFRETGCRTCYDNCPYEAITLDTRDGARYPLPVVDSDLCNGCGACEAACISLESGSLAAHATEVAIVVRTMDSLSEEKLS
jgi:ferredoxin-type protein NapG